MNDDKSGENGFCASHENEIEKRQLHQNELSSVKGRIGELLSFKNRLIGFAAGIGVFAVIVILGSYTYTYNHTQEAERTYSELALQTKKVEDAMELLRRDVYDTRVQLARTDERYQALQNQLRSIDSRLEQLLAKISNAK